MNSSFAYSLDGNLYHGSFASRKEARLAGFEAARQQVEPPGVIYVARVQPVDPKASGLAAHVIHEMNRRFRDTTGETRYLMDITDAQRQQLDRQLEQTILQWLTANQLLPQGQQVEAISEYPVPVGQTAAAAEYA